MRHPIVDRLLILFVLEIGHLVFVLTTVDALHVLRPAAPVVALELVLVSGLLGLCVWMPWFATRSVSVVRVFGAALLIASTALGLSEPGHSAGFVTLACLGAILLASGMGRVRPGRRIVAGTS